ncbi:MAG TPA: hypothetical protein VK858_06510 [Longimicrobiales bacterium]|nr:hypothetical protein [Longimicrobiales bacterium]
MRTLTLALALLVVTGCTGDGPISPPLEVDAALAKVGIKPAPSLDNTIDYVFVAHLGVVDAEGRLLVWEADIDGDVEGQMKWWFVLGGGPPNMPEAAHVAHYEGRWEIWSGGEIVLAGHSAGTTAQPKGKDGIWRGAGKVTETAAGYEGWMGSPIFEGGNVNWDFPFSGQGIFRVN